MRKKLGAVLALAYVPGVGAFTSAFGFFLAEVIPQNKENLQFAAELAVGLTILATILSVLMFFQKKKMDRENSMMAEPQANSTVN